eukprot:gene5110-5616_t
MTTILLFLFYLPIVLSYWPLLPRQPLNSLHRSVSTSSSSSSSTSSSTSSVPIPERDLIQYDSYGGKQHMRWNTDKQQFEDPDYYRYSFWRALQRLVSATTNVFGTQALLLALGFRHTNKQQQQQQQAIGLAAATSWVLKDALGKFSRIVWASKFGRRFDIDAKKWRFRSALLYSTGNLLEIVTYLKPTTFLLTAACATACKQMAMLTSSSTRNTIYKSFSKNIDNIGDVTAKGEAQSAIIDLLGLSLGVILSKIMNASNGKVVIVFGLLIGLDLFCVYHEIRSVVFHTLNFERVNLVLKEILPHLVDRTTKVENLLVSTRPGDRVLTSWSSLGSIDTLSLADSITLADQEKARFVLVWKIRDASLLDGIFERDCTIDRGHHVSQVVLPHILLHRDAGHTDLFQAFIVIHKVLQDLHKMTDSNTTIDEKLLMNLTTAGFAFERIHRDEIKSILIEAGWDMSHFSFGSLRHRVRW